MPQFRFKYREEVVFQQEVLQGWRVSIVIYGSHGKPVRELSHAMPVPPGNDLEVEWDGKNDAGLQVSGRCGWRILITPGITAQYLLSLGSTLPIQNDNNHQAEFWETGLGNHVGPRSAAVDEQGNLYLGAGNSENVRNALKMEWDEQSRTWTRCSWSAFYPVPAGAAPISVPGESAPKLLGKHLGRWALGVLKVGDEERLYHLQQNGWVGWHRADDPNKRWEQYVFDPTNGNADTVSGGNWDALFPCDARPTPDSWIAGDEVVPEIPMDLTTGYIEGRPVVVISHLNHDLVQVRDPNGPVLARLVVRKPKGVAVDAQGRVLVISGDKVLRFTPHLPLVPLRVRFLPLLRPLLRVLNWIRCWLISILPPLPPPPLTDNEELIRGLTSPYRIDVDRSSGDVLIAETGQGQQVKRFDGIDAFNLDPDRSPSRIYGREGGRWFGQYFKHHFRDVVDICADQKGGFIIVEGSAPRRIAHIRDEVEDTFDYSVREWYGGTFWVPTASADPLDPASVWVTATPHEIMRLKVNYDYRNNERPQYQVEAVYRFTDLTYIYNIDPDRGLPITVTGTIGRSEGGGIRDWYVRRRKENMQLYLIRRDAIEVLRVDDMGGGVPSEFVEDLVPVAVAQLQEETVDPIGRSPFTWVKGRVPNEYVEYRPSGYFRETVGEPVPGCETHGLTKNNLQSLQAPAYFDYFRLRMNNDDPGIPCRGGAEIRRGPEGGIFRLGLLGWTTDHGAPIYDLTRENEGQVVSELGSRTGWILVNGPLLGLGIIRENGRVIDIGHERYYQRPQGIFAQSEPDRPLYIAVNREKKPTQPPPNETDLVEFTGMYKLDLTSPLPTTARNPERQWAWKVGLWVPRRYRNGSRPPEMAPPAGHVYSLWNNVGAFSRIYEGKEFEVVVATDYDGGWSGYAPAIVYVWDHDGLYVGNPFSNPVPLEDLSIDAPMQTWAYVHSSDNRSGTLLDLKGHVVLGLDDGVLYFAGGENEIRIYLMGGWHGDNDKSWIKSEGEFNA